MRRMDAGSSVTDAGMTASQDAGRPVSTRSGCSCGQAGVPSRPDAASLLALGAVVAAMRRARSKRYSASS